MSADPNIKIAPFRSLNDFLFDGRWSVPDFSNMWKLNNRILSNLLYYQSNYISLSILLFLLVGYQRPLEFLIGSFVLLGLIVGFIYSSKTTGILNRIKRDRPLIVLVLILALAVFLLTMIGYIAVFLLGILLPILCVLLHAAFRMRNISNKMANKAERFGLTTTPMGMFLESIGATQKLLTE